MNGTRPGLPPNYAMPLSKDDLEDKPADIGDFLDLDHANPAEAEHSQQSPQVAAEPEKVVGRIGAAAIGTRQPRNPEPTQHSASPGTPDSATRPAPAKRRSRKQVNMSLQTIEMLEELLVVISRYSSEKNPKASELLEGLVATLYEAKETLDLSSVPARGPWGSQTAQIFKTCLKTEMKRAIARHQTHLGELYRNPEDAKL